MDEGNEKLSGDHRIPRKEMFRRIGQYVRKEKKSFILAFLLILVSVGFSLVFPYIVGIITDNLQDSAKINLTMILAIIVGYFILELVSQGISYLESIILQKAGQRIVYQLRMDVFSHIERLSQNQFNNMPVGSLVTRVANYTSATSDLFTDVIVSMVRNICTVIGVYGVMLYISPLLSLVLLGFVIVTVGISYFFEHFVSRVFRTERKYISDLNTCLDESLSGMKITQLFGQEKRKISEFGAKNEALRKIRYKVNFFFTFYRPLVNFLYYVAVAVIFLIGTGQATAITAGEIVSFYLYSTNFFSPIENLADQLNNIQKSTTAMERLFNLLDVPPQVLDKPEAVEKDHFEGKIEFRNVWFAYNDENWILKDVSFVIEPKQTVAFVGATGAGKTTILSLVVRNYEIQKGQILIDDIDIKDIKIESLRKCVGQMLQDVFLFSGTIRDNITLHDDSYSDQDIWDTCRYVNADTFIEQSPEKLQAEVTERGENYSQGQRQLLSFARTVLAKPQILILDEATANIDTETEVLIQQSLDKIKNIGTMLVVAHRLSTVQKSDQIIVLQHGEIIERGTHQSLLKERGYYYKLYQLQFTKGE